MGRIDQGVDKGVLQSEIMDEVGLLPARTKSKRTRSTNSSRDTQNRSDRDRTNRSSPTSSSSTPRGSRPSLVSRSSAPLVPSFREAKHFVVEDDSDAYSHRDSVASIKDDPFFRNYQSPHSVSLARELRSATYSQHLRDEGVPTEPPPRSSKRPSVDNSVNLPVSRPFYLGEKCVANRKRSIQPQSRSGMSDINIAVIGSNGVGKSTLIQRALGLRALPTSIASSLRMSVDNVVYTVSLIELDLESFDVVPDRRIQWPKQINGHIVPRMDGALLLYDVMNRESITELPQTLSESPRVGNVDALC